MFDPNAGTTGTDSGRRPSWQCLSLNVAALDEPSRFQALATYMLGGKQWGQNGRG